MQGNTAENLMLFADEVQGLRSEAQEIAAVSYTHLVQKMRMELLSKLRMIRQEDQLQ